MMMVCLIERNKPIEQILDNSDRKEHDVERKRQLHEVGELPQEAGGGDGKREERVVRRRFVVDLARQIAVTSGVVQHAAREQLRAAHCAVERRNHALHRPRYRHANQFAYLCGNVGMCVY
jgi:Cu/Zn superoxide dismutase